MPDGLLETLEPEELLDLVSYLRGSTQAPIAATAGNIAKFFGGATEVRFRNLKLELLQ